MPTVDENRQVWDGSYDWAGAGDEWSAAWGTSDSQWHSTLLPRIQPFLPARRVLEIATGFGRWSGYLIELSESYVGVDLAEGGVAACRQRYAAADHAEFHTNDGRSLSAVADSSIDLAFSFDSLVHVEDDVIGAYLEELSRTLAPEGVAFLHHSNLAACAPIGQPWRLAINEVEKRLGRDPVGLDHWRGRTMSAERFQQLAKAAGLSCVGQEIINWEGSRMLDCISVVARPGSRWDRPNRVVHNPYFMAEAASAAAVAETYLTLDGNTARHSGEAAAPSTETSSVRFIGPLATRIAVKSIGPWAVSVLGPMPRWRQFSKRSTRG